MSTRDDASFLDGALDFASLEARHWVADALACHLHNTGYALQGNTETSDVEWFAHRIWQAETGRSPAAWDAAPEDSKEQWRHTARIVIKVLPEYQLRVAHRLIELSKVVRDIERAIRETRQRGAAAFRATQEQETQNMSKWRKKPVVIEAWRWNETQTLRKELEARGMLSKRHSGHRDRPDECTNLGIGTGPDGVEGTLYVAPGDWIIRGVKGEFYPCRPDIFAATYEPVE